MTDHSQAFKMKNSKDLHSPVKDIFPPHSANWLNPYTDTMLSIT